MMKIEQIQFAELALRELVDDENVFGVTPSRYSSERFSLKRLAECEVGEILSGEIAIIRILKD